MSLHPTARYATVLNILGNAFLFFLKLFAGLMSGSIALISDALNSFTDIISSIAVFICVRISNKAADDGHPFGHSRAEPIAGIIVAILAGILGFEMIRSSVGRFFHNGEVTVSTFTLAVPVITVIVKLLMAWYFKKAGRAINSPAIMASYVDSLCDILVSIAALIGIVGVSLGYPLLDPVAGLVISLWIIYTGYKIGLENIDYLMGRAPDNSLMDEIKSAALSEKEVKQVGTVRAHYVGNFIHVEIHIMVDRELTTLVSHAIGEAVAKKIEAIEAIEKSFVHIDPV